MTDSHLVYYNGESTLGLWDFKIFDKNFTPCDLLYERFFKFILKKLTESTFFKKSEATKLKQIRINEDRTCVLRLENKKHGVLRRLIVVLTSRMHLKTIELSEPSLRSIQMGVQWCFIRLKIAEIF